MESLFQVILARFVHVSREEKVVCAIKLSSLGTAVRRPSASSRYWNSIASPLRATASESRFCSMMGVGVRLAPDI
jgi:hypothetical protein